MNKKTLIIIAVVLGIVALGIGAYFAWKNRAVVEEIIPAITGGVIAPTEQKEGKFSLISSREVAGYWVLNTSTSSEVLYIAQNGNVVKIDQEGIEEIVNKETILGLRAVVSAKDGSRVMVSNATDGRVMYRVYDVKRNEWLLANGDAASLSPDGTLVASLLRGVLSKTQLSIQATELLQTDDENRKNILSLAMDGLDVSWIKNDELILTQKPSADYISDMWKIDIKKKKLSKFLSDRGLMVQWSPMGDRALKFTTTEGRAHKLAVINDKGAEVATMRFVTMPDKCAIMTPTQIYCAIPRDQEDLSHKTLPDDYLKRDVYFKDGIYQVDIEKGGIRAIFEEETPNIDATDLTVLEDRILFINRYDRKLYSLKLQ